MPIELTNPSGFENWAQRATLEMVYASLSAGKGTLRNNIQELIRPILIASPEYQSILSGKLRGSLGIADQKTALDEIANAVLESVVIDTILSSNEVSCTVSVLKDDFSEVLSLESASYTYDARPKTLSNGRRLIGGKISIEWLSWLLFSGTAIVVLDAKIATVSPTPYSRTGSTIMIHPANAQGWAVPAQYSGTQEDNWLSRSLSGLEGEIIEKIWQILN